jgi:tetratricopeptide (TPR) repeat protein
VAELRDFWLARNVLPGTLVAQRFEIERRAGSGGMGDVYRALDRDSSEPVAIKVLRVERHEESVRFSREAALLAELRHPGIVRYVAHGLTELGLPWLAMEWLEGETLGARLARGGLGIGEGVLLAQRIAEALDVLHGRGIVHRDLKPGNVVLVDSDVARPKILDFGIARFIGGDASLTRPGMLMGTPGFMAPEQARGEAEVDVRADVFALGCILYRCLTGRAPFAGSDPLAILLKVMLEDAPRPSRLAPEVPPELDALVARMLAKQPADRPPDAGAVVTALGALPDAGAASRGNDTAPPPSLTSAERKVMCLVLARFADTGVMPRSEPGREIDAARTDLGSGTPTIPTILGPRLRALRHAAEVWHGMLDILADGSVVVVLASAGAATDLCARAARCALTMRGDLGDAPMIVATGQGVLEATVPVGDVIERAVKMLERCGGGQRKTVGNASIRLDQATAGLLDERFDVGGDADGLFLRGERQHTAGTRTLLGKPTPTVGRERELGTLVAIFEECSAEPVARAVLVTAPAGGGKSRVRFELLRRLEAEERARAVSARGSGLQVWMARGDPMSAGSPLGMLAMATRRTMGIFDGEPLAVRQKKLAARVARHFRGDEARRIAEFLGELTGAPYEDARRVQLRAARQDARLMGDQVRRAWEDWVAAECKAGPLLLVLEDLHWGDLPTVKFVEGALRRLEDRPFMVLALARPEVRELFPRLWEERGLLEMRLLELTRKASEKLVREVLGEAAGAETVARIVEHAQGNAFYLEELIRAVAEGKGTTLPDTVLAMVQARLESLPPEARRAMRAASVFGESFWEDGILELCGGQAGRAEMAESLRTLVEQEVIGARAVSRFPGEREYVFRHALVREVAFSMLTDTDRALGHRLAGAWLERAGETDPLLLAEHFERGGERPRAVSWYRRAAEMALEAGDLDATLASSQRGIACGAEGEERGVLGVLQGEAYLWRGDVARAEETGQAALDLLTRGSPLWFRLAGGAVLLSAQSGKYDRLATLVGQLRDEPTRPLGVAAQALCFTIAHWLLLFLGQLEMAAEFRPRLAEIAETHGRDDPLARGWVDFGRHYWAKLSEGEPAAALCWARESSRHFEAAGDVRTVGMAGLHVAWALSELGRWDEAIGILRGVLAAGARRGMGVHVAHAKRFLAPALAFTGALDEALAVGLEAKEELADNRMTGGVARKELARVLLVRGDAAAAEREAAAGIEQLMFLPFHRAHAQAIHAQALLALGEHSRALAAAHASMASGNVADGDALARLVEVEALAALGKAEQSGAALRAAHQRLQARADRVEARMALEAGATTVVAGEAHRPRVASPAHDLRWRERFLSGVVEHARTVALFADYSAVQAR